MTRYETPSDDALKKAFAARASAGRADGLFDMILADIAATPQQRAWRVRVADALTTPWARPAIVMLVLAALLLAAAMAIAAIGAAPADPLIVRPQPLPVAPPAVVPEGATWGQVNYPVDAEGSRHR